MASAILVSTAITPLSTAFASGPDLNNDVKTWWSYNALLACFSSADFVGEDGINISESDITSGNWFGDASIAGDYMRSAGSVGVDVSDVALSPAS